MIIRIPKRLVRMVDSFVDWANVPLYVHGKFEIRCIDIVVFCVGVACTGYYLLTAGLLAGIQAVALYSFTVAAVIVFFPRNQG
jgi:hypothetical protein